MGPRLGSRLALELAGNLLAELLAEMPTALLAEIFLLLAENSRNFKSFLRIFMQTLERISSKFFLFDKKTILLLPKSYIGNHYFKESKYNKA